ncbi:unnamed protein product, partial [Mesorhabditis spiculigera]
MSESRAPTVSDLVGQIDVRPVILPPAHEKQDQYAPTYHNIDVLWKPSFGGRKNSRTLSTDSDGDEMRRISISDLGASGPTSPTAQMSAEYTDFAMDKGMAVGAEPPRTRRMSLSEMIFGSPGQRRFTWGEKTEVVEERKGSVTEDSRFKEILRLQRQVNDEGGLSHLKASDYRMKD